MQLLSSNRRSQLRRSLKQYGAEENIHIHESATVEEALGLLNKLAEYHQIEWKKRGWDGAFANP
ncbi:MAG: hypothetical protein JNJ43_19405, partial [Anaerolineales bacterium]|nr:hypothetical protein [Anaerolineales bacterium]